MLAGQLSVALCSQLIALITGATDTLSDGADRGPVHLLTGSVDPAIAEVFVVESVWMVVGLH